MNQKINLDEGVSFGLGAFETIAVEDGRGILLSKPGRAGGPGADPDLDGRAAAAALQAPQRV